MSDQTTLLTENERTHIIIGVLVAMFPAALDQTIVSPAMSTIGAALGDGLWLSWVISAYLLTSTAVTPLFGKLADLRGRRSVLHLCIAIFLAGSVICALAPTMAVLIGGRAVQGVGDGGLIAVVQTIIADVAPPKERGRYYVYISTLWGLSSVAGPVVGGALAEHVHWSMIFWINLPIGAACYVMSSRALTNFPDVRRNQKLDVLSALMVIVATVLLLLALTWGGTVYPWGSLTIGGLICASLLVFVLFAWHQLQPEDPLLPTRVLANPIVACASAAVFFSMTCFIGLSVYFPIYLQLIEEFGAAASGLALVALMGGASLGSNVAGRHMQKSAHYKRIAVVGACIAIVSLVLLGLLADKAPFPVIEGTVAAAGFGFGTLSPIALISVQNVSEQRDLGIATATLVFLRSLGSVVGLATLSTVVGTTDIASHIGSGTAVLDGDARAHVADGFRWVFYAAASSQVLSLLFLIRMEEKPLRGHAPPVPVENDSTQL
ncbi:MDR family MFS transporter [Bradyrhizobium ivorense]|uniref:MDR family MFS transporter n=1 Tax=Bradyrhizobium ivorense TaxID=2511166 RepID=UPI0010B3C7BF|nr:MDR family MFS transporter [Bradyrhizobium ivorense]VIO69860.1 Multidrug resistance protein 3 [Bradyrhizobium ivorense]